MCDYLKRMSPQDTPTDDIRLWSGLAHSVVECTGPEPSGMDGSLCLWLHERSATQLLDMCDELDAKFSDLQNENAKLRELVLCLLTCASDSGDACDRCPVNGGAGIWEFEDFCDGLLDRVHELGIEVGA